VRDVFEGGGFNAKVVNDEAEHYVAPHVPPEDRGVLTRIIPFCVQTFLKEFVGQYAGLEETICLLTMSRKLYFVIILLGMSSRCHLMYLYLDIGVMR
jgi:hypothetical protein